MCESVRVRSPGFNHLSMDRLFAVYRKENLSAKIRLLFAYLLCIDYCCTTENLFVDSQISWCMDVFISDEIPLN